MAACIFCDIVAGSVPSHRVYEDDQVIAFLDIGPVTRGHTLVVPRAHAQTLDQLQPDSAAAVGRALVKVGGAVAKITGAVAWNVLQNNGESAGQVVPHVHFHVIPRYDGDGFSYDWRPGELTNEEAASLKMRIGDAMR